jgi:hypothetical protein
MSSLTIHIAEFIDKTVEIIAKQMRETICGCS